MSKSLSDIELVQKYLQSGNSEIQRLAVIAASGLQFEEPAIKPKKSEQLELNFNQEENN